MNIQHDISLHELALIDIQRKLIDKILALPDNDKIKRVSDHPKIFIANSSDVMKSGNMTPEHHDFKLQYELIARKIRKSAPARCVHVLYQIVNGEIGEFKGKPFIKNAGKIKAGGDNPGGSPYYVNLHPEVIKHIKKLLEECC